MRLPRLRAVALVRHCSASASVNNKPITGAVGSRGTRGSGKSLIGSAARGVRGDKLEAMKSGEYGVDGAYGTDDQLMGADVLMEVLAEDHRASKMVEFVDEEMLSSAKAVAAGDAASASSSEKRPWVPAGPNAAQRKYLSHRGVSGATVFARAREAGQNRAERAMEAAPFYLVHAPSYMPLVHAPRTPSCGPQCRWRQPAECAAAAASYVRLQALLTRLQALRVRL